MTDPDPDPDTMMKVLEVSLKKPRADLVGGPGSPGTYTSSMSEPCPMCKENLLLTKPVLGRVYGGLISCEGCGFTEGYTNWIGRNLFPVEQMPDGAKLLYDPEEAE